MANIAASANAAVRFVDVLITQFLLLAALQGAGM
jgi:hypothetical protein